MNIPAFFDYCIYEERSKRAMALYIATHNWHFWQAWMLAYVKMRNIKKEYDYVSIF